MAIITQARMQQLRGKYNQLNKEAMLPGEIAICDDHNPVVRTNTGYKEILTKDNAEYFEEKVTEIDNAVSSANEAVNNANQAINDMGTATTENTQKVDNAIAQLETDKEQKFTELDTNVSNTVSNAVSDLNTAKEQAISDMGTATTENTQRVDNALQQITTKIGIDDTQASTTTTYSSDKIDKLLEAIGGGAGLHKEIVEELPTSDIKDDALYLLPSATSETNNVYDEYIYIDGSWELIGSTKIDLSDYYKKNEVDTLLEDKLNTTGDASEVTVDFEEATERAKPTTGEKLKLMMGKIAKLFTDLKTIAFSGSYNDLSDTPTIPTLTNSLTATVAGTALDATQGKALNDKITTTNSHLANFQFRVNSSKAQYSSDGGSNWSNFRNPTGNAGTGEVLSGKTFANASSDSLTGTMTNRGAWTSSPTASGNVTIPAGYHNGSGYVNTSGVYTTGYNAGKANATLTLYATVQPSVDCLYLPSQKTNKDVAGFHFIKPSGTYYIVMEYAKTPSKSSAGNYEIVRGYYERGTKVCIQSILGKLFDGVSDGVYYWNDYSNDDSASYTSVIEKIYIYV